MNFKRIIALVCVVAASFGVAMAQDALTPAATSYRGSNLSFVAGNFVANNYFWGPQTAQVYTGNAATGSSSITIRGGYVVLSDGRHVVPYSVGVPLVVSDASPELITPIAVSGCYNSQGENQDGILVTCTVTASFANLHGAGASILSATGGLAEAVNDAVNWGGGVVVIAPGFYVNTNCTNCYASTSAAIQAVLPVANVVIADERGFPAQNYAARPTGTTTISAPSTPTLTFTSGSGSYYCAEAYVDIYGQISAWAEGSQATSSAFPATLSVPAAATGAVGVVAGCTAASGSSKGETMYTLTPANCTLTKLETVIPACAITNTTYGQTATATISLAAAPATTTAKINGIATGDTANNTRTASQFQPVAGFPALIPTVYASLPASSSGNTGTYEIGRWDLPAGFFNNVGEKKQVCIDYEATPANTATVTFKAYYGPYNNSDTLIASVPSGSYSGTGAHTQSQVCFNLTTVTTGASGSILSSGFSLAALASNNVGTLEVVDNSTSSPIIGSLPLSTQQQIRLEAVVGTANLGTAITVDGFSINSIN